MTSIVPEFFEAAEHVQLLVERPEVISGWDAPSCLPGYRVGGLAAHLTRGVLTVDAYLSAPEPAAGRSLSAAEYHATVLGDLDPIESDLHAGVRARSETAAASGPDAVAADLASALRRLERRSAVVVDRRVAVLDGVVMRLGDYLESRLVELAVHSVDVADSVGVEPPDYELATWDVVARVLYETAVARSGARSLALGLARPERHGPSSAYG